ncbi:MAG: hypothetical protein AAB263_12610, partial [Planctomycetota bacterium]
RWRNPDALFLVLGIDAAYEGFVRTMLEALGGPQSGLAQGTVTLHSHYRDNAGVLLQQSDYYTHGAVVRRDQLRDITTLEANAQGQLEWVIQTFNAQNQIVGRQVLPEIVQPITVDRLNLQKIATELLQKNVLLTREETSRLIIDNVVRFWMTRGGAPELNLGTKAPFVHYVSEALFRRLYPQGIDGPLQPLSDADRAQTMAFISTWQNFTDRIARIRNTAIDDGDPQARAYFNNATENRYYTFTNDAIRRRVARLLFKRSTPFYVWPVIVAGLVVAAIRQWGELVWGQAAILLIGSAVMSWGLRSLNKKKHRDLFQPGEASKAYIDRRLAAYQAAYRANPNTPAPTLEVTDNDLLDYLTFARRQVGRGHPLVEILSWILHTPLFIWLNRYAWFSSVKAKLEVAATKAKASLSEVWMAGYLPIYGLTLFAIGLLMFFDPLGWHTVLGRTAGLWLSAGVMGGILSLELSNLIFHGRSLLWLSRNFWFSSMRMMPGKIGRAIGVYAGGLALFFAWNFWIIYLFWNPMIGDLTNGKLLRTSAGIVGLFGADFILSLWPMKYFAQAAVATHTKGRQAEIGNRPATPTTGRAGTVVASVIGLLVALPVLYMFLKPIAGAVPILGALIEHPLWSLVAGAGGASVLLATGTGNQQAPAPQPAAMFDAGAVSPLLMPSLSLIYPIYTEPLEFTSYEIPPQDERRPQDRPLMDPQPGHNVTYLDLLKSCFPRKYARRIASMALDGTLQLQGIDPSLAANEIEALVRSYRWSELLSRTKAYDAQIQQAIEASDPAKRVILDLANKYLVTNAITLDNLARMKADVRQHIIDYHGLDTALDAELIRDLTNRQVQLLMTTAAPPDTRRGELWRFIQGIQNRMRNEGHGDIDVELYTNASG